MSHIPIDLNHSLFPPYKEYANNSRLPSFRAWMTGPNTASRLNSRRSGGLGIKPIGNDAAIKYININLQLVTITVNCRGMGGGWAPPLFGGLDMTVVKTV
jgi:hypothetical protein